MAKKPKRAVTRATPPKQPPAEPISPEVFSQPPPAQDNDAHKHASELQETGLKHKIRMDLEASERLNKETASLVRDAEVNRLIAWWIVGMNCVVSAAVLVGCGFLMRHDRAKFSEVLPIAAQSPAEAAKIFEAVRVIDAKVIIALVTGSVAQLGAALLLVFVRGRDNARTAKKLITGSTKTRSGK